MRGNVDSLTLCLFDSFFRPSGRSPERSEGRRKNCGYNVNCFDRSTTIVLCTLQHGAIRRALLGAVVWPTHTTVGKRLRSNFYQTVRVINEEKEGDPVRTMQRLNSYMGLMRHFRSYRLRRAAMRNKLAPHVQQSLRIPRDLRAVAVRQ